MVLDRRQGWTPVICAAAVALWVTGCAVLHRPPTTVTALAAERSALLASQQAQVDRLMDTLARRAVARGDHTLDVLFLSGGGQDGAYGAGFLRGWRTRPTDPSPRFDLVTGVSAGALQSPFALLGTADALNESSALFRQAAKQFAPTLDWWSWIRHTGGITNVARLRATVKRVVDENLQSKLNAEYDSGRRLMVATTDFDLGVGHGWGLIQEMGQTPAGLPRARSILMATSAIPGIFPPVVLDGHVHADGGVISNVYVPFALADFRRLEDDLRRAGVDGDVTVRVWVVLNLWEAPKVQVMDPSSRGEMHSRAGALLFASQQPTIVSDLNDLAHAVGGIAGLRMEVRATAIPESVANAPGADKLFDERFMQQLDELGYDRARGSSAWDHLFVSGPSSPSTARVVSVR